MDTTSSAVHSTNTAQAAAWDGDEGQYWAEHADEFDASIAAYHRHLLQAAAIGDDERVLDIGCGTGQVTRDAATRAAAGHAVGIDLSSRMLEVAAARARAAGVDNATFVHADAQVYPFEEASFDLAVSRTGAMFFGDRDIAFTNIARAIRPGGRMILLAWQPLANNEWLQSILGALAAGREMSGPPPGAPGPFALSEPDYVDQLLQSSGFDRPALDAVEAPMYFGPTVDAAVDFILGLNGWMLRDLDEHGRANAVDALRATVSSHVDADGVRFGSAAWLIGATRP